MRVNDEVGYSRPLQVLSAFWPLRKIDILKSSKIELPDLNITEKDLVKVFLYLLEAELFKVKNLADENPLLMPTHVSTIVDSSCDEALWVFADVNDRHRS
jgi:hypothetical protein